MNRKTIDDIKEAGFKVRKVGESSLKVRAFLSRFGQNHNQISAQRFQT